MEPLALVASMVLEAGGRWGECATPDQWDDMTALLTPGGPRRHFWLRARGRSKPLALDTPLPTPSGWTTMGDVRRGDKLFDELGRQTTVTLVGDVLLGEDCWRVTFDDGSSIVASGWHEWAVEDHRRRRGRSALGIASPHDVPGGVAGLPLMTTRDMREKLTFSSRQTRSLSVPCARTWDLPDADLPLPPYVLGYWLGDGHSSTAMVTIGDDDVAESGSRFEALGYPLHSPNRKHGSRCASYRFGDGEGSRRNGRGPVRYEATRLLRDLGVLGGKHIPMLYLRSSEKQRLELLRGLMDSDGFATQGQAQFSNISERLAGDTADLAASLGWKVRADAYTVRWKGKDNGLCYAVKFCPDVTPFHLSRKTAEIPASHAGRRSRHASRMVASVDPVATVPVRCIAVDSPGHLYLAGRSGIPTHNTFDAGAATAATMLVGGVRGGDEMYAAAAGKDQAGLLARKIRAITDNTPELAGSLEVQQHKVIAKRTGAVLDVLSSELASSWGKTPRWLFVDEICNHETGQRDRDFITALMTSLVKRRDSQCLVGSTPSSPEHWSKKIWDDAESSRLWRASIVRGAAPWQDPEELAEEKKNLPDFMWRRLFECEWVAAGDALADEEALAACTRHDGSLAPRPGVAYVVAFDLSVSTDHTAVAVMHLGERDGIRDVVVDRLEAWVPGRGRQVDLADVELWIASAAREYGGASIVGDPYQAVSMIGRLREAGFQVKPVTFSSGANSKRAQMLLRLVRDRQLDIPDDSALRSEFLSLRLAEGTSPGILRLTSDGSSLGHFDRVTAVMLGAEELLARPTSSWKDYCGDTRTCEMCSRVYLALMTACRFCGTPNPEPLAAMEPARQPVAAPPSPGSWASAYLPPDARRCPQDHLYAGSHGDNCPKCAMGARLGATSLPGALAGILSGARR